jgi:Carboxypeptidase regulatory-like domain
VLPGSRTRQRPVTAAIAAGLVAVSVIAGFTAEPKQQKQPAARSKSPTDAPPAVLYGRVTNESGDPLADARVSVAVPAANMRFLDPRARQRLREATTDANGNFWIELPGVAKPTLISVDAAQPGYQRFAADLNGFRLKIGVSPGAPAEVTLKLKPARYFNGVVVNEQGRPIPGVQISANAKTPNVFAGVETTVSTSDGSFEIFNYPLVPEKFLGAVSKGLVSFFHPDYIEAKIDDVYALPPREQENLRIVLEAGHTIAGTVMDVAGNPASHVLVKVVDGQHRKATMSDRNGKFVLRGVAPGLATLTAHAFGVKQTARQELPLDSDRTDFKLRLRTISLPPDTKTYKVLGMTLTDVTPQLKSAYDLFDNQGALILEPGYEFDRLHIGYIAPGYDFWIVGDNPIGGVRDFLKAILAQTARQSGREFRVRVVYSFSRVDFDGTNTQYMTLTKDDLKELQAVLDQPPQ